MCIRDRVTDAGSPAISDPGEDLVRLCAEHGVTVCAIPGPCALVTDVYKRQVS